MCTDRQQLLGACDLLKISGEGEAPAKPQTMESVIFHAAWQELRPPEDFPS